MITQIVAVFFTLLDFSISNYLPNYVTANDTMNYPLFVEPRSRHRDQKAQYHPTVMIMHRTLYIGSIDHVYVIDLDAPQEENIVFTKKLIWEPTDEDVIKCKMLGKSEIACRNFIKVLIVRNDDILFVCGTNALKPSCRNYKIENLEPLENIDGRGKCPFKQHESNVALFSDGSLYSATALDMRGQDRVIYRSFGDKPHMRTAKFNSKWLKEPFFIHGFDYGNYIYFFFREISVEYEFLEKVIISRVARVCKNDIGSNPSFPENELTSFLKARMTCAIPCESSYHLQAVSDVILVYGRKVIFAIYSTSASIPSSALCAFDIEDIDKVFTGRFKEKATQTSFWTPVPEHNVPTPRPGSCAGSGFLENYKTSKDLPSDTIDFIRKHSLMDESMQPISSHPLYLIPHSREIMTRIAVDNNAGPNENHTVVFAGTDQGKIYKFLLLKHDKDGFVKDTVFLEIMVIFNNGRCTDIYKAVKDLKLDKPKGVIYVVFSSCIISVPIGNCERHLHSRNGCLASRDPYCGWVNEKCVYLPPGTTDNYEQNVKW